MKLQWPCSISPRGQGSCPHVDQTVHASGFLLGKAAHNLLEDWCWGESARSAITSCSNEPFTASRQSITAFTSEGCFSSVTNAQRSTHTPRVYNNLFKFIFSYQWVLLKLWQSQPLLDSFRMYNTWLRCEFLSRNDFDIFHPRTFMSYISKEPQKEPCDGTTWILGHFPENVGCEQL